MDSLAFGQVGHAVVNTSVESENDCFGGRSQEHVGLSDRAHGAVDDFECDLFRFDFLKRVNNRFDRTLSVGLDDDFKDFAGLRSQCFEQVFQRNLRTPLFFLAADFFDPFLGERARVLLVLYYAEFQAGFRHSIQCEHLHRNGWPRFLKPFSFLVYQRADFAPVLSADNHVADMQRSFANQHGGRRPSRFEAGLDHVAFGKAVGVGFELQDLGLEHDHFEQLVDALLRERRNVHKNCAAAPLLTNQSFVLQLLADSHRVGVWMVGFVDRDDGWHIGRLGMAQGFERLRHDAVIGRNDQHYDVRHVGAAGAH